MGRVLSYLLALVCDLRLQHSAPALQESPMTALLGTIYYIAPEVIRGSVLKKITWGFEKITDLDCGGSAQLNHTQCARN